MANPGTLEAPEISPELARVFDYIADGLRIREACKRAKFDRNRFWAEVRVSPAIHATYTRAREAGTHELAEEVQRIADGVDELSEVSELLCREHVATLAPEYRATFLASFTAAKVQRDRVRTDTLKWAVKHRLPKVYGDKIDITNSDGSMRPAVAILPPLDALPVPDAAAIGAGVAMGLLGALGAVAGNRGALGAVLARYKAKELGAGESDPDDGALSLSDSVDP